MVFGFNSPNVDHDWDQHQSSASSSSFSSFWNYSSNMESSTDSDADPSSRPKRTRPPIPDKCVARIFLFLTPADVLNSLSRVCPRWFLIATDNFVWKRFFIRDWTHPLAQDVAASVSVETGLDNPFSAPHNRRWLNRYRERTWLVHQIHAGALQRAQTVDGMMSGMRWEWAPYLEAGVIDQWENYVLGHYRRDRDDNYDDDNNNNNVEKNNNNNNNNTDININDDNKETSHHHRVPQNAYCHTLLRILPRNHQLSFVVYILGLIIASGTVYGTVLCSPQDRQQCSCRADGTCPGWDGTEYACMVDLLSSSNGYVRIRAVLVIGMLIRSGIPLPSTIAQHLDSWLSRMLPSKDATAEDPSDKEEELRNAQVWELAAIDILNAFHDSPLWHQDLSRQVPQALIQYGPTLTNIERWADRRRHIQVLHMELDRASIIPGVKGTHQDSSAPRPGSMGAGSALRRLSNNLSWSRRRSNSNATSPGTNASNRRSAPLSSSHDNSGGEGNMMLCSVYVIHVVIGVREWILRKSYRQLSELKQDLRTTLPHLRRQLPRIPKENEKEKESVRKMDVFMQLCPEEREIWRSPVMQEFTTTNWQESTGASLMDAMSPRTESWDLWSVSL